MKKLFLNFFMLTLCVAAQAQNTSRTDSTTIKQGKYTLTFINQDPSFDPALKERMIKTFFTVYPELAKAYNRKTARSVTMVIDTAYKGVAETANARVTISSAWMHKRPEDIDVITHEVMHIVQDYGDSNGPGWLTEGIADYVRYKFGVNNAAAKWSLPAYKPTQNFDNAYRITARFLLWMEEKIKPGIVRKLDEQMRLHTFTNDTWTQLTGKTVDELWKEYAADPTV